MMGRRHSQFKKILIGYDGSAQSDKATENGLALAQSLDAKVLLFAVARPPEPATMVEVDAMLDDAPEPPDPCTHGGHARGRRRSRPDLPRPLQRPEERSGRRTDRRQSGPVD